MMKILIVGIFSNPASTNIQSAKAFERAGNNVKYFEFRALKHIISESKKDLRIRKKITPKEILRTNYNKLINKVISFRVFRNLKYYLFGNWKKSKQLVKIVKNNNFDLVFLNKINNIHYKIIPQLNKYSKTWYYFMDPLETALNMNAHKYAKYSTWSSATFSIVNRFFNLNGGNSIRIIEGVNMGLFKPSEINITKKIDVMFFGSLDEKRRTYVDFLRANNVKVICFGRGWENPPIYLKELIEKCYQSRIILNFTRDKTGFSDRVVLIIATGSFLISEYCTDLKITFEKGVHLEWFKNPKELLELIKKYLKDEDSREKISKQGCDYVRKNFTWDKIIEKIMNIVTTL